MAFIAATLLVEVSNNRSELSAKSRWFFIDEEGVVHL
jgi:hypothetical protein